MADPTVANRLVEPRPVSTVKGPFIDDGAALFNASKPPSDDTRTAVGISATVLAVLALVLFVLGIFTISGKAAEDTGEKRSWGVTANEWCALALLTFVCAIVLEAIFIGSRMRL